MDKHGTTYSDKVGLPPGTLIYIGKERSKEVKMLEIVFSADQYQERSLPGISDCSSWENSDNVTIVSVIGIHDTSILEEAGKHFGLDPMSLENIADTQSRPRFEEFKNYLFLPLNVLGFQSDTHEIIAEHISLVLAKNGVIIFKENDTKVFYPLKDRIRHEKGLIRARKSDYIFYRLIDTLIDNYFIITEYLSECLDDLEERILRDPNEEVHEEIYNLKRKIAFVKRTINPLRECILNIRKSDSHLISEPVQDYFKDVYDHLLNLLETVDSQREIINDVLNLHMSAVNNKLNEVMRVLTVFASIFIPLTFLAGIYGMNFDFMPELHWEYGYVFAWGIMLAVVGGLLIYFRRKNWL